MREQVDRVRVTKRVSRRGAFACVSNLDWVLQSLRAALVVTGDATSLIPSSIESSLSSLSSSMRNHALSVQRDREGAVRRLQLRFKSQSKEVQLTALYNGSIVLEIPGQATQVLRSDRTRVRQFLHVVSAILASSSSNVDRSVSANRPSAATLRSIALAVHSDPPTFFLYRATDDFAILTTMAESASGANERYEAALQRLEDSSQFCDHCLDTPTLARFDSRALEFFYNERWRHFGNSAPNAESVGLYRAFGVRAHPFVTPEYELASRDGEFVCLDVVSRVGVFCHASLNCDNADGSDAADETVEPPTERALLRTLASQIRRHFMLLGSGDLCDQTRGSKWVAPSATRVCRVTAVPAAAIACCDAESASSARKQVLRCAGAYLCRRLRAHAMTTTRFDDDTSTGAPRFFGDWSDMIRALLFEPSSRSADDTGDGVDSRTRLGELFYGAIGLNNDADLDEFRTACAACTTSDERTSSREMECRRRLYREFGPLLWSPLSKMRATLTPAEGSPLNLYRVRHRRDGDLLVDIEDLRVEIAANANGERFRITAARIVTVNDDAAENRDDDDGRPSSDA
ncbi:hypothetical protein CYMTET_49153 [Cymbomonas tetramitiformis]|uniref:Uncharacterized protein n=1 Tax=Cymbomonas tetramitiformis TaxID=36881 RepID=A0AAE0BSS0_9CHLO|nr:hypothetical protein CYMTET_49153 [Cymbomonas tetramitiformis]